MHISIGAAAMILGVSISTMRRWDAEGFLLPKFRTAGGHRRYSLQDVESLFSGNSSGPEISEEKVIAYARVSSFDQKRDLETQKQKLAEYCGKHFKAFDVISDLGSGLNFRKPGLRKLLRAMLYAQVQHLVLNYKDRLLRFGSELIFDLCKHFGVKVTILEAREELKFEEELVQDVIELMTVFSAKLYGKRSHKNRSLLAA
jgi:putative resolvase